MKFGRAAIIAVAIMVGLTSASLGQYDAEDAAVERAVPPSKALRAMIVTAVRDILFDPYSVRDAEISNVADFGNGTQGVCVRVNAKNRMGGYTRQSLAITVRRTIPFGLDTDHPLCARADVKWHSFPELEALPKP